MGILTEEQLILLSSFIYLEGVTVHSATEITVGTVVRNLLEDNGAELNESRNLKKIGTIGEYPALISRDGWLDILKAIEADEQLCKLTITHPVDFVGDGQLKANGKDITAKDQVVRLWCLAPKYHKYQVIEGETNVKKNSEYYITNHDYDRSEWLYVKKHIQVYV